MKFSHMDLAEMERQRYKSIKESKKYLELDILIGAEDEDIGEGQMSKIPIVSTIARNIGAKEVGCLYMTLKSYLKHMMEEYPDECIAADMAMEVQEVGHTQISKSYDLHNKEDNDEN